MKTHTFLLNPTTNTMNYKSGDPRYLSKPTSEPRTLVLSHQRPSAFGSHVQLRRSPLTPTSLPNGAFSPYCSLPILTPISARPHEEVHRARHSAAVQTFPISRCLCPWPPAPCNDHHSCTSTLHLRCTESAPQFT